MRFTCSVSNRAIANRISTIDAATVYSSVAETLDNRVSNINAFGKGEGVMEDLVEGEEGDEVLRPTYCRSWELRRRRKLPNRVAEADAIGGEPSQTASFEPRSDEMGHSRRLWWSRPAMPSTALRRRSRIWTVYHPLSSIRRQAVRQTLGRGRQSSPRGCELGTKPGWLCGKDKQNGQAKTLPVFASDCGNVANLRRRSPRHAPRRILSARRLSRFGH